MYLVKVMEVILVWLNGLIINFNISFITTLVDGVENDIFAHQTNIVPKKMVTEH